MRIFRDSPSVTLTYADLRRVYEDMLSLLEIVGKKRRIGFATDEEDDDGFDER